MKASPKPQILGLAPHLLSGVVEGRLVSTPSCDDLSGLSEAAASWKTAAGLGDFEGKLWLELPKGELP